MAIPDSFKINNRSTEPFSSSDLATLPKQQQLIEKNLMQSRYIARTVKWLSKVAGLSPDDIIEYCERSMHIARSPMEDFEGNTYYGLLINLQKKYEIRPDGTLAEDYGEAIQAISTATKTNIFISHGHNEIVKLKLINFLSRRLGLNPIVLTEQPNEGLTIIEKLEKYSRLSYYAIVLLTKDDLTAAGSKRTRQNVIHEMGFFHGKFGRNKVLLLQEEGVEIFSNIDGILTLRFHENQIEEIYERIRQELENSGIAIRK